MTEFNTPRENRGINIGQVKEHPHGTVTDLTSAPVYGGYRVSYNMEVHDCQSRVSGQFVSVKECGKECDLKLYLEGKI